MSATGVDHRTSSQKAEETDVLKEKLHGWRAAILTTDCFLCWEKLYYPVVLLVVVSIKFLLVYWLDPSILTGLSTLVMFVCLADYMVPIVTERFFGPDMYLHEQQQQRFHEICSQLVQSKHAARAVFDSLCTLRQERPRMYYITVLLLLALVAWIGHQIHNLLLTYLLVVFGLMLPGLNQHGFVSKYSSMVWQEIDKLAKRKEKSQ